MGGKIKSMKFKKKVPDACTYITFGLMLKCPKVCETFEIAMIFFYLEMDNETTYLKQ